MAKSFLTSRVPPTSPAAPFVSAVGDLWLLLEDATNSRDSDIGELVTELGTNKLSKDQPYHEHLLDLVKNILIWVV